MGSCPYSLLVYINKDARRSSLRHIMSLIKLAPYQGQGQGRPLGVGKESWLEGSCVWVGLE
jgi:hypothetical protein